MKTMTLNYSDMPKTMIKKAIFVIGFSPIFITGCTGLTGTQPPAPVYSSNRPYNPQPSPQHKSKKVAEPVKEEIVQVQPLEEFTPTIQPLEEIKTEPIANPIPVTPSSTVNSDTATNNSGIPKVIEVPSPNKKLLMPTPPEDTGIPKFEPKPISEFKPAESTVAQSPAVTALVTAATKSSQTGDIESASAAIERAIRIEPRNAELLYKLAVLRLKQSKPILAEELAKKAALLAGKDNTLKKNSWLLIAHAKEMQNDKAGAEEAKNKAAGF